jgi:crossover junction endodeoxyribonuclease RuvC
MLQRIVTITEEPKFYDATDALAVAICHHYQTSNPLMANAKKMKGWEDFIKQNADRIKIM